MPQSGTTVSVESVDHVFQTKMIEMLKQTGRCDNSESVLNAVLKFVTDQKWLSAGITRIQVSDVGYRMSTSIPSRYVPLIYVLIPECYKWMYLLVI